MLVILKIILLDLLVWYRQINIWFITVGMTMYFIVKYRVFYGVGTQRITFSDREREWCE